MSDANTASGAARPAETWAATRAVTRAVTRAAPPNAARSVHVKWRNRVAAAAAAATALSGRLSLCRLPTLAGRAGCASLPAWFGNGAHP